MRQQRKIASTYSIIWLALLFLTLLSLANFASSDEQSKKKSKKLPTAKELVEEKIQEKTLETSAPKSTESVPEIIGSTVNVSDGSSDKSFVDLTDPNNPVNVVTHHKTEINPDGSGFLDEFAETRSSRLPGGHATSSTSSTLRHNSGNGYQATSSSTRSRGSMMSSGSGMGPTFMTQPMFGFGGGSMMPMNNMGMLANPSFWMPGFYPGSGFNQPLFGWPMNQAQYQPMQQDQSMQQQQQQQQQPQYQVQPQQQVIPQQQFQTIPQQPQMQQPQMQPQVPAVNSVPPQTQQPAQMMPQQPPPQQARQPQAPSETKVVNDSEKYNS